MLTLSNSILDQNKIPKEVANVITDATPSSPFEFFLNALQSNAAVMDMSGTIIAVHPAWKRFNKSGRDAVCFIELGKKCIPRYIKDAGFDHIP